MSEWSFQRRLITGVVVICALAVLTSIASLVTSRVLVANLATVLDGVNQDVSDARQLQLAGVRNIVQVQACILHGGDSSAAAARAGGASLRRQVQALMRRNHEAETHALLEAVLLAALAHEESFTRDLTAARRSRSTGMRPTMPAEISPGQQLGVVLSSLVTHLEAVQVRNLAVAQSEASRAQGWLIALTVTTSLFVMLLCAWFVTALNRSYRQQLSARSKAEHGQTAARVSLSEVEAASQLKDEFLATVSHELRNPLAPILTWTQLLRSGTLDEAKTRRALEVIERSVTSQAQLIDDLVDVSRVVSGKFRLDVRPIDLVPVIRGAAESQGPASEAKQIRVQLVLDERAGLISGDSERLQQVMGNLLSNAIKFTPKGGRVQVVLRRVASHIEIEVSDSGIGIEESFLPHVFEPFRQGTGGPMRRHGGLGLGLSIVRHIVELHGGEIAAHSEGPGSGARFLVQFPLPATAPESAGPLRRHPIARDHLADVHLGRLDGTRVLVVEDEPSAAEALIVLFQSCGAEVRGAASAEEALRVFAAWRPDVMVSDIAMPGEDGYSLIRRIRKLPAAAGGLVPAVALTAYAKIEDRVTILSAGFQMYLSKPADPNELVAVVGSLAARNTGAEPPAG